MMKPMGVSPCPASSQSGSSVVVTWQPRAGEVYILYYYRLLLDNDDRATSKLMLYSSVTN